MDALETKSSSLTEDSEIISFHLSDKDRLTILQQLPVEESESRGSIESPPSSRREKALDESLKEAQEHSEKLLKSLTPIKTTENLSEKEKEDILNFLSLGGTSSEGTMSGANSAQIYSARHQMYSGFKSPIPVDPLPVLPEVPSASTSSAEISRAFESKHIEHVRDGQYSHSSEQPQLDSGELAPTLAELEATVPHDGPGAEQVGAEEADLDSEIILTHPIGWAELEEGGDEMATEESSEMSSINILERLNEFVLLPLASDPYRQLERSPRDSINSVGEIDLGSSSASRVAPLTEETLMRVRCPYFAIICNNLLQHNQFTQGATSGEETISEDESDEPSFDDNAFQDIKINIKNNPTAENDATAHVNSAERPLNRIPSTDSLRSMNLRQQSLLSQLRQLQENDIEENRDEASIFKDSLSPEPIDDFEEVLTRLAKLKKDLELDDMESTYSSFSPTPVSETNLHFESIAGLDKPGISSHSAPLLSIHRDNVAEYADEVESLTAASIRIPSAFSQGFDSVQRDVKQYNPAFAFQTPVKVIRPPPGMSPRRDQRPLSQERQTLVHFFEQNRGNQITEEDVRKAQETEVKRQNWRHGIETPFESHSAQTMPLDSEVYPYVQLPNKRNFKSKAKRTLTDWSGPPKDKDINEFQHRIAYLDRLLIDIKRHINMFPPHDQSTYVYMREVVDMFKNLPHEETTRKQLKKAQQKVNDKIEKAVALRYKLFYRHDE